VPAARDGSAGEAVALFVSSLPKAIAVAFSASRILRKSILASTVMVPKNLACVLSAAPTSHRYCRYRGYAVTKLRYADYAAAIFILFSL
jgi:hypothetical protein